MATSRGPELAPSGAKTELQETANELRSVPPQDSPLAFCSVKPSIVASVTTGKVSLS